MGCCRGRAGGAVLCGERAGGDVGFRTHAMNTLTMLTETVHASSEGGLR